jgi:hypothetical protein
MDSSLAQFINEKQNTIWVIEKNFIFNNSKDLGLFLHDISCLKQPFVFNCTADPENNEFIITLTL